MMVLTILKSIRWCGTGCDSNYGGDDGKLLVVMVMVVIVKHGHYHGWW